MFNKLKNNNFLRLLYLIVRALTTLFIVIMVSIIFIQKVSKNNLTIGGIRIFTVITGSMLPEYEVGDMIISKETDPKNIKIGDDVVYEGKEDDFNNKIITHRVIDKKETTEGYSFVTKGINNDLEDPAITDDQLLGKVIYKSFVLSFVSKLINNSYSFYFVLFVPFVILVFFEIVDVLEEKRKEKLKGINDEE